MICNAVDFYLMSSPYLVGYLLSIWLLIEATTANNSFNFSLNELVG